MAGSAVAAGCPAGGRFWERHGAGGGRELPPQRAEGVGRPFTGALAAPCVPRVPGGVPQRCSLWLRPFKCTIRAPGAFPALCLCRCRPAALPMLLIVVVNLFIFYLIVCFPSASPLVCENQQTVLSAPPAASFSFRVHYQ